MHLRKIKIKSDQFPTQESYPFNLEIFNRTKSLLLRTPITFFIGENGTGKSTLLKALAQRCAIHIWRDEEGYERRVFYRNQYAEELYKYLEIEWIHEPVPGSYFDSEIFRYLAECIDSWAKPSPRLFDYYSGDSLLSRSHGQRHIQYFESTYRRKGIYFLDEPENALSPRRQIDLLKILKETSLNGQVQFIIVTHSPILLSYPEAAIYSFDEIPISEINYEDTDYYKIYKDFLNHRDRYLQKL
ncbi:MAG: AAA family ATPase [Deltaproteobacteria bacterium]|nr:AAA family ATPase [Deltaproteobacteria bacterium]